MESRVFPDDERWYTHTEGPVGCGETLKIICPGCVPASARYVYLLIPGSNRALMICEFEVYTEGDRHFSFCHLSLYHNTLRPRQNGGHFPDNIFKRIFVNKNVHILINVSLKFVPKGPINNIPALFQIMAWRRPGDKPLSEPIVVRLLTHICATLPQCVKVGDSID